MAKSDYEVQMDELEKEKDAALESVDKNYSDQIAQSDSFYNSQIDAVRDYKEKQSAIQQEQTDFTIGQLQQQKEQTQKDYQKEQSAAYVDFKKQTDPHGVNAEQIAAGGMWGSGYSESAQTAMYNEYQNRVATAKAALDQAVVNYNTAMAQAQAQNSSVLAEIAYNAFVQETELAMQAFASRNALLEAQTNARAQVESNYMTAAQRLQDNMYSVKPSFEDNFTKWVTYLADTYSNGHITDETLWNNLVDTYGETALKQAGFSNTGPTVGGNAEGTTGTSIEEQVIKLGIGPLTAPELLQRIESGELILTDHGDGTYTLEHGNGQKKGTKPGSALHPVGTNPDEIDLSNISKPAPAATFVPSVTPGSDPAQAAGQVLGQWIANLLGF